MASTSRQDDIKSPRDLQVNRPVFRQSALNVTSNYVEPKTSVIRIIRKKFRTCEWRSILPILIWLPQYKWKTYIVSDLISGITMGIMHIPQGIAYGLLANVEPVIGLYTAFFPVFIYVFFGTSRHISIGTFAVICLMTGQVVTQYASDAATDGKYTGVEVVTTLAFIVAIMQICMYILRLGALTALLSETLVNGFTCGSAIHVISSQLKDLLGVTISKRKGKFIVIFTIYDVILATPEANKAAIFISIVSIIIMIINNELFKPWLATKTRIPFPIELFAIIIGTTICYFFEFHKRYAVTTVGYIPTGFPRPALPIFALIPKILVDSITITVVSYIISVSLALILAQKGHYEIDANQEFLALGMANIFGSFFSAMPVTASLSRSMIQYNVGGVTQITSIISCLLMLVILLWIAPLFETLPRCILASIIVVALKGMLIQCIMLRKYWNLSKWDAAVWLITFSTTVLVSLDIGLISGIVISLLNIIMQGQRPYACLLGAVPNTEVYLDCKLYKGVNEIEGIKIFQYCGALNFASKSRFKSRLLSKVEIDPQQVIAWKLGNLVKFDAAKFETVKCIILDMSAVSYIDPTGAELLISLANEYNEINIALYLACVSGQKQEILSKCGKYGGRKTMLNIFPTIHDAVLYAQTFEF